MSLRGCCLCFHHLSSRGCRSSSPESSAVSLQPAIPNRDDWTREQADELQRRLEYLSLQSALGPGLPKPNLILWPEMPAPIYYFEDTALRDRVQSMARTADTHVLMGTVAHNDRGLPLNAAVMLSPAGEPLGRYDKMFPVPFGEYIPWPFGAIARKVTKEIGDFEPGSKVVVFPSAKDRVGAFICYESAFPHLVRQFAVEGATVFANLSNDGYFGRSAAREQHLSLVRMPAAENRRWILRSTNAASLQACAIRPAVKLAVSSRIVRWPDDFGVFKHLPNDVLFALRRRLRLDFRRGGCGDAGDIADSELSGLSRCYAESTMLNRRAFTLGIAGSPALAQTSGAGTAKPKTPDAKQIYPGVWKLTLGQPERFTPCTLRRRPVAEDRIRKLPAPAACPIDLRLMRGVNRRRGYLVSIPLGADEIVYGLGLQLKSHIHRGLKRTLRVNADPVTDAGDSHAPVPFYVTTAGYGVLIDTARYASFWCGGKLPKGASANAAAKTPSRVAEGSKSVLPPAYFSRRFDQATEVLIEIPSAAGADVYIFSGPSMRDSVQRYNLFSGGGCVPPRWGLGVWYRTFGEFGQDEVSSLAKELRSREMPCDVIGLEPGWQSHAYPCSFVWSDKFRSRSDSSLRCAPWVTR